MEPSLHFRTTYGGKRSCNNGFKGSCSSRFPPRPAGNIHCQSGRATANLKTRRVQLIVCFLRDFVFPINTSSTFIILFLEELLFEDLDAYIVCWLCSVFAYTVRRWTVPRWPFPPLPTFFCCRRCCAAIGQRCVACCPTVVFPIPFFLPRCCLRCALYVRNYCILCL